MELHGFKSGISEIRNRPISSLRTSLTVTGISCSACVPANKNMHLRPQEGILHVLMCMHPTSCLFQSQKLEGSVQLHLVWVNTYNTCTMVGLVQQERCTPRWGSPVISNRLSAEKWAQV